MAEAFQMKISEQGFTERIPSQTSRTSGVSGDSSYGSSSVGNRQSSPDNLQLSNLAALLQKSQSLVSNRSARVSEIASAVQSKTFQLNPAQISSALVSEAAQTAGR